MVEQDARLSQGEIEVIKKWMSQKLKQSVCSMCGENQWHIGDHLVASPISPKGVGMMLGEAVYPQVMMICTNCSHTVYFNAVAMGIVEGGKKHNEEKIISGRGDG